MRRQTAGAGDAFAGVCSASSAAMLAEGRIPVVRVTLTGAPAVANHRRSGGLLARRLSRVQKEMKGRYPKHVWPDDPATAVLDAPNEEISVGRDHLRFGIQMFLLVSAAA